MQGPALQVQIPGYAVRPATTADLDVRSQVCLHVHGPMRDGEGRDAISQGACVVVEHGGRITGYATGVAFFAHAGSARRITTSKR